MPLYYSSVRCYEIGGCINNIVHKAHKTFEPHLNCPLLCYIGCGDKGLVNKHLLSVMVGLGGTMPTCLTGWGGGGGGYRSHKTIIIPWTLFAQTSFTIINFTWLMC